MDEIEFKGKKKEYHKLQYNYFVNKNKIIDDKKNELKELKYQYKIDRAALKDPIKAEELRLKYERKRNNHIKNTPPKLSLLEEIGNSVSHSVGALIGIVLLILMLLKADTTREYVAASVYGGCLIMLMTISCLYHAFRYGSHVKHIFRRFDYSSIYLLIAGTFAPLFLVYWQNTLGIVLFIVQWALVLTGITIVAIFGPGRLKWVHFPLYFILGWSAIVFFPDWIKNDLKLFGWLLGGGLVYCLGMIPFGVFSKQKIAHFIWHFFVLGGAIVQWVGIYIYVF